MAAAAGVTPWVHNSANEVMKLTRCRFSVEGDAPLHISGEHCRALSAALMLLRFLNYPADSTPGPAICLSTESINTAVWWTVARHLTDTPASARHLMRIRRLHHVHGG